MKFDALKHRVERGESLVEGRLEQTRVRASAMKAEWRQAWTPTRIIVAGLVSGFLMGYSDPARALRKAGKLAGASPRWLQTITAISGLFASLQAAIAAATAKDAAETADDAADGAQQAASTAGDVADQAGVAAAADAPGTIPDARRRSDPTWPSQPPAAAEAATDVSER